MAKDLVNRDKFDLDFNDSDMMMVMMMAVVAIMMTQFLSPLNQNMQAQTKILESQSYHGTEDPRILHVTNVLSWLNLVYDYPFTPWISAYIINDGPSSVELGINYPDDRFTMNPGETITVNRTGALDEKINIIFCICRPGLQSSLRITGTF